MKVFPTTDDVTRFKKLKEVILEEKRGQRTLAIEQVKFFKNMVILKLKGVDSMNDAEFLSKCTAVGVQGKCSEIKTR